MLLRIFTVSSTLVLTAAAMLTIPKANAARRVLYFIVKALEELEDAWNGEMVVS